MEGMRDEGGRLVVGLLRGLGSGVWLALGYLMQGEGVWGWI